MGRPLDAAVWIGLIGVMSTLVDVAQMVSGVGAGGAALAAFLTVRQAASQQRSQTWPHLVGMPHFDGDTRRMNFEIHNAGKGLARQVFFAAVAERQIVFGPVGTTFVRPGESVVVRTMMQSAGPEPDEPPYAALWCMDIHNNTHAFAVPEGEATRWHAHRRPLLGLLGRSAAPEPPYRDAQPALAACCVGHDGRRADDLAKRGYACKVDGGVRVYEKAHQELKKELFPEEYQKAGRRTVPER